MPELNANQQKLQAFLARPDVPEEAKRKAVALYDATPEAKIAEAVRAFTPTDTGGPDMKTQLRAAPATAGAMRGGQLGYEAGEVIAPAFGPFAPVVPYATAALGAGVLGGAAELGLGAGQRALGVPEGQAPLVPRAVHAGKIGALTELVGRPVSEAVGAALSRIGRAGEALRTRLGIAGKYDIPIGASEERAGGYAGTRGASGVVTRAARRQSSAIATAGERIIRQLGGTLDTPTFTASATRSMRQTLRSLERAEASEQLRATIMSPDIPPRIPPGGRAAAFRAQTEGVIGKVINEAKVADALAKNPAAFAELMRTTGGSGLQDLQRSWLTGVLESATGKTGLRKGLINSLAATDAWDALGQSGQQRLFGPLATDVGGFFDALRQAEVSRVGGKQAGKLSWSLLQKGLGALAGGGMFEAYRGGGGVMAPAVAGAAAIAQPWIAARMLTSPGGAKIVAGIFGGPVMRGVAQMTPAVVRGAAQLGGQLANPPPDVPDHVQVPP